MPNERVSPGRLDDGALIAQLKALAAQKHEATAALVASLAEIDTRDLHLRHGYNSLFIYCRDALALAEHEAYCFVAAAYAARRFPLIVEMLAQGSIALQTVKLLAPCLTPENHRQVLESARGKRRAQIEEIVAMLVPQPDVPPAIERLLSRGVAPLSGDRYKVQLTLGAEAVEKLRLAKDMLRHALPAGSDAAVLERALTALLEDLARKKFAGVDHPRPARGTASTTRYIPAEVRRGVWLRDLGRCAFVGSAGRRCGERGFLEFHHVRPYAAGGAATLDNIELRCRRHNDYEARAHFGPGLVREPEMGYASRTASRSTL